MDSYFSCLTWPNCKRYMAKKIIYTVNIIIIIISMHQAALGREIHALSSASKPLAGWMAQSAIQECREACGGHGYLASKTLLLF